MTSAPPPSSGPPPHPPSGSRQRPEGKPPLARIINAGLHGADRVVHATGVSAAIDEVIEEAIIRAFRSPAVRRALERALAEDALAGQLEAIDVAELVRRALESDAASGVWAEVLASVQAQMLVERIADAPEVRAALTAQGAGLLTDIGIRLTRVTEALDDSIERVIRPSAAESETNQAGLATRGVAAGLDLGLLFLLYTLASTMLSSVLPVTLGGKLSLAAIVVLTCIAMLIGAGIVVAFWALVGQTPGMRFLSIRIVRAGRGELGLGLALRRMAVLIVGVVPAGLGFLWIAHDRRRRGWHDIVCGTEVVYEEVKSSAPHSRRGGTSADSRARADSPAGATDRAAPVGRAR